MNSGLKSQEGVRDWGSGSCWRASPNPEPLTTPQSSLRSAFTLIELLVVVTIIGILVGIVLGVSGLVTQKGDRARAIADMEKIKNALEEYRIEYGNYPVNVTASDSSNLVYHLWTKPWQEKGKPFLTAKFLTNTAAAARFLDPWGNDYQYLHYNDNPPVWVHNRSKFGYDLWSLGPNANSASNSDDIANWQGDF